MVRPPNLNFPDIERTEGNSNNDGMPRFIKSPSNVVKNIFYLFYLTLPKFYHTYFYNDKATNGSTPAGS